MEAISPSWRKSSNSSNGGANCVEVNCWQKSSYSCNGGGNCVEVGHNRRRPGLQKTPAARFWPSPPACGGASWPR